MRSKLLVVSVLLTLAITPAASAQLLPLATAGGSVFLTTSSAKLAKALRNSVVNLSPLGYEGALVAVAAGLVVIDPQKSIDTETIVGPPKAPISSIVLQLQQKNANGGTSTLGQQTVSWEEIIIPGIDPDDLDLPEDLPVAVAVFLVPAPPAGASHTVKMTPKGGSAVPPNFAIATVAAGIDVSSLGLDPETAARLVNMVLEDAESMMGLDTPIARARPGGVQQR